MLRWLAVLLLFWFLYHVREAFPPFIVGGIFAYLLLPVVNGASRKLKIPPKIAVAFIYIAILGLIIGLCSAFGKSIAEQINQLANQRQEIVTNLVQQLATGFNWQIDVAKTSEDILNNMENNLGKPEEIVHLGGLLSKSLLAILVCIVSSIYFIVDSERVGKFLLRFVPEDRHETVIKLFSQMNIMLSKYVRGQLVLVALMSCVAYFFLHFCFSLKYALVISIASGFLEIIPVLGPTLAILSAIIVGVSQKGVGVALPIFLCYWVARLVEDYIVVPRFIGHTVELHPLAIIFAVLCGEIMAGGLGMLIAIPVAASIKEIIDFCYPPAEKRHSHPTKSDVQADPANLYETCTHKHDDSCSHPEPPRQRVAGESDGGSHSHGDS